MPEKKGHKVKPHKGKLKSKHPHRVKARALPLNSEEVGAQKGQALKAPAANIHGRRPVISQQTMQFFFQMFNDWIVIPSLKKGGAFLFGLVPKPIEARYLIDLSQSYFDSLSRIKELVSGLTFKSLFRKGEEEMLKPIGRMPESRAYYIVKDIIPLYFFLLISKKYGYIYPVLNTVGAVYQNRDVVFNKSQWTNLFDRLNAKTNRIPSSIDEMGGRLMSRMAGLTKRIEEYHQGEVDKARIHNARVYSEAGNYRFAISKLDDIDGGEAKKVFFQTRIREEFAKSFSHGKIAVNVLLNNLIGLCPDDDATLSWALFHRSAYFLLNGNHELAILDLKKVAEGKSWFCIRAGQYLVNYYLVRGENIAALYWLKMVNGYKNDRDLISRIFSEQFCNTVGSIGVLNATMKAQERLCKDEFDALSGKGIKLPASDFQECELTYNSTGQFVAKLLLYPGIGLKVMEGLSPVLFAGLYADMISPTVDGPNLKSDYERELNADFSRLSRTSSQASVMILDSVPGHHISDVSARDLDLEQQLWAKLNDTLAATRLDGDLRPSATTTAEDEITRCFLLTLGAIEQTWKSGAVDRQDLGQLHILLLGCDSNPEKQQRLSENLVLFLFDEPMKCSVNDYANYRNLVKAILNVFVNDKNRFLPKHRDMLKVLYAYPSYPRKLPVTPVREAWLLSEFLYPNTGGVSVEKVRNALLKVFGDDVLKGEVPDSDLERIILIFIMEKSLERHNLSPYQNFILGMAANLMALQFSQYQWDFHDLAITKFKITIPMRFYCYAALDWRDSTSSVQSLANLKEISDILSQYDFSRTDLFQRIALIQELKKLHPETLSTVRPTIRSVLADDDINERFAKEFQNEVLDVEAIATLLRDGADPNIPLVQTRTNVTKDRFYIWTKQERQTVEANYPIHRAMEMLDREIVNLLVDYGADLSNQNIFGLGAVQHLLYFHGESMEPRGGLCAVREWQQTERVVAILKDLSVKGVVIDCTLEELLTQKPKLPPDLPKELRDDLTSEYDFPDTLTLPDKVKTQLDLMMENDEPEDAHLRFAN